MTDDPDGLKRFRHGTHRVASPQETLARAASCWERVGLTRLAVLTGLDVIGIPVVAAVRPNSRSVAVHQGKGISLAAAKASAVMEAIECWHAETVAASLRLSTFAELGDAAIDIARLPRTGVPLAAGQRLLWMEGRSLVSGRPVHVPFELVSADFTAPPPPASGYFQATTNGLASGNHHLEAIAHALHEVIERDAVSLWQQSTMRRQAEQLVDPDTVDGEVSAAVIRRIRDAGATIQVWDITSDIGVATFLALLSDPGGVGGVQPELGAGCHPDPDIALSRALTEAAQARLTTISGARDDLTSDDYEHPARVQRHELVARWAAQIPARDFRGAARRGGMTMREDIDVALAGLAHAGIEEAACVDLTHADLGIPVVRVIVPGLEGPWTVPAGEYRPGERARRAGT